MLIYLNNGKSSMTSKIKLSFDEYFNFLEEYFEMFKLNISKEEKNYWKSIQIIKSYLKISEPTRIKSAPSFKAIL